MCIYFVCLVFTTFLSHFFCAVTHARIHTAPVSQFKAIKQREVDELLSERGTLREEIQSLRAQLLKIEVEDADKRRQSVEEVRQIRSQFLEERQALNSRWQVKLEEVTSAAREKQSTLEDGEQAMLTLRSKLLNQLCLFILGWRARYEERESYWVSKLKEQELQWQQRIDDTVKVWTGEDGEKDGHWRDTVSGLTVDVEARVKRVKDECASAMQAMESEHRKEIEDIMGQYQ